MWRPTAQGRMMPVETVEVLVVAGQQAHPDGQTVTVLDKNGRVVTGRLAQGSDLMTDITRGHPVHWQDCPGADRFRKGASK